MKTWPSAVVAGLIAAACVQATPEKVLRQEAVPGSRHLCERMAEDFDMVLAEGDVRSGRLFRVSHADRLLSAGGVSWGFLLRDEDPVETCATTAKGTTCEIRGPAEFEVRSNAGRASYQVIAGNRARVASEGAMLTCKELR